VGFDFGAGGLEVFGWGEDDVVVGFSVVAEVDGSDGLVVDSII
jgi:hypothetical protein